MADFRCCSSECRHKFYQGSLLANFVGTYVLQRTGVVMSYFPRKGYVQKYMPEHRVIASKALGRMLYRHEFVLHVDNDHGNNSEENLYVCGSRSECAQILAGSLPWPTRSNLQHVARRGVDGAGMNNEREAH
jgi:hypothetical protein